MAVPKSRILDLMKVRSKVFSTVFNPTGIRQGTKVLAARLKGPSIASYYPERIGTIRALRSAYPEYMVPDLAEESRMEYLQIRRLRGKGAPKKKKTAEESKKRKGAKKPTFK